jgi:hypothetical protein
MYSSSEHFYARVNSRRLHNIPLDPERERYVTVCGQVSLGSILTRGMRPFPLLHSDQICSGAAQSLIQWVIVSLSSEPNLQGSKSGHSPAFSAKVKITEL